MIDDRFRQVVLIPYNFNLRRGSLPVGKEHGAAVRNAAAGRPDFQAFADKSDHLDALQCTLKQLVKKRQARSSSTLGQSNSSDSESSSATVETTLLRTYPYNGDTIVSYTLHFKTREAATVGAGALAALRGHVGHVLSPERGCDGNAQLGVLLEVESRVGCDTGFLGARCNYHCATRWERFESRMHTVNDQTSPAARANAADTHAHHRDQAAAGAGTKGAKVGRWTVQQVAPMLTAALRVDRRGRWFQRMKPA